MDISKDCGICRCCPMKEVCGGNCDKLKLAKGSREIRGFEGNGE